MGAKKPDTGKTVKGKKTGRTKRNAAVTGALFGAAVLLLGGSAVGSTRAALTYFSEDYTAQVSVSEIGVSLVEDQGGTATVVSNRDYSGSDDVWEGNEEGELLTTMLADAGDEKLMVGKTYKEELTVTNSGSISEYVRVRLFKSWQYEDGTKETELSPDLIVLGLTDNGWIEDTSAKTEERTVLYYPNILESGETAPLFMDTLTIDGKVASKVSETRTTDGAYTTVTTEFAYEGVTFKLRAEVDAVQTHNAADAIKSAWGVNVNIADDGTLSLAQ